MGLNRSEWYIRGNYARDDIMTKAQLAANNSGLPQLVWEIKNPDDPNHSGRDVKFFDGQWWVKVALLTTDPVAWNAGRPEGQWI